MEWQGQRESGNVENRGWGGAGMAIGGGSIGAVLLGLLVWFMGGDPSAILNQGGGPQGGQPGPASAQQQQQEKFVRVVLASTEDVWSDLFRKDLGKTYRKPKLVLFSGRVKSACGLASSATGPFYCPEDEHVYLDLQFFDEMRTRFHAPGEFAEAYVIAHEVGHHVQKLLGYFGKAQNAEQSGANKNQMSVRLELQADFLAGIWGHYAKDQFKLTADDLASALKAANAIGDDRLQKQAQGYVVPEKFTHGTSAQRVKWLEAGFKSGNLREMDQLFTLPYGSL